MNRQATSVLSVSGLTKTFTEVKAPITVLDQIDLDVKPGDRIAVIGASGSGKSTLLHLLGGLDVPTQGTIKIAGMDITRLSDADRGRLRNEKLGFIYQFHHLLPELTAVENVAMPLFLRRGSNKQALSQAQTVLEKVGLGQRLEHKPAELSGGERQRAAVARALVTRPAAILADEPTGNLDHQTATNVFDRMLELNAELDTSLVLATHDRQLAQRMDHVLALVDGVLKPADLEALNRHSS